MSKKGNMLCILVKCLDFITWVMMVITFIISILTMIVVFGIAWNDFLAYFWNFKLLEICLAISLFLWGITSIIGIQDKKAKRHGFYSIVFGGILMVFLSLGVY